MTRAQRTKTGDSRVAFLPFFNYLYLEIRALIATGLLPLSRGKAGWLCESGRVGNNYHEWETR
jgi:hypothetical protein